MSDDQNFQKLVEQKDQELSHRKSEAPLENIFSKIKPLDSKLYGEAKAYDGLGLMLDWNPRKRNETVPKNLPLEFEGFLGLNIATDREQLNGDYENIMCLKDNPFNVPIYQNDLIIDPYQVYYARYYGTGYMPLYPNSVSDNDLLTLFLLARQHGMEGVIHVRNSKDLESANNTPTLFLELSEVDYFGDSMDIKEILELSEEIPEHRLIFTRLKEWDEDKLGLLYDAEINGVILEYPDTDRELKKLISILEGFRED